MNNIIAKENFARWSGALLTKDPKKVAALYADNLTLLPTMQTKTIADRAGALKYFEFFGAMNPTADVLEEFVIPVSADSYVHCGVYRFTIDNPKGGRKPLDARFSFLWKKKGEIWEILHHHSSRVLTVKDDGSLIDGTFGG